MRRKPPVKPLKFDPRDVAMARQFYAALEQTEDLPYPDRWPMTLELLSDEFLIYVLNARRRSEADRMNLYGLLGVAATEHLLGEKPETDFLMVAMLGITISCVGELERRHKRFTADVELMRDLFGFDPNEPLKFHPKDPENFDPDAVYQYYYNLPENADTDAEGAEAPA